MGEIDNEAGGQVPLVWLAIIIIRLSPTRDDLKPTAYLITIAVEHYSSTPYFYLPPYGYSI